MILHRVPLSILCWAMLVAVWAADLASPQVLVVAILLAAPVALTAAGSNVPLTIQIMSAALIADASAAWFNAYNDHFHWQPVAVGDRILAAVSVLLVGMVAMRAIRQTAKVKTLADRNARADVMRDLMYALAHDLRTPLTAARMTLRQALEGAYGSMPAQYRDILQTSIASNEEVTRLAETLLSVARYEAGEQSTRREPVGAAEICASTVTELTPYFEARGIALSFENPGEELEVRADAGDLRRAITNIVANAANSTPAGGHVRVGVFRNGGFAIIRVEDDGYGVPEEMRAHMFERFVGRSKQSAGAGLGLYIVRRIAEAHSGTVSYEPRAPKGSTFCIAIPLTQARVPA